MDDILEIDRCPSSAEMQQARDGELSSSRAAAVLTHMRRCASCRDKQQAFDTAVQSCREYTAALYDGSPTASRAREIAFLHALRDQSRKQARIQARAARWPASRWLPIAALVPLIIALTVTNWPSTTLQAEELLERAALAEQSRPAGWSQKVLMRVTSPDAPRASTTHTPTGLGTIATEVRIGGDLTFDLVATAGAARDAEARLKTLYAGHHLDWQQPLSIARIRAWRASLAHKRETVTPVDADKTRLHITTDEGVLSDVDVVVHNVTYGVISQTLVFRDVGTVEVTAKGPHEIRVRPTGQTAGSGYKPATTPIAPTPPVPPTTTKVRPLELPVPSFAAVPIPHAALSGWLDDAFPHDAETRAKFLPELARRVFAVKRDFYMLSVLAQRTSSSANSTTAGADASAKDVATARAALKREIARQTRALTADLDALAIWTSVMFGSSSRPRESEVAANWQRRTSLAMAQVEEMERQLKDLLARKNLPKDEKGQIWLHPFNDAFGALWDTWHTRPER